MKEIQQGNLLVEAQTKVQQKFCHLGSPYKDITALGYENYEDSWISLSFKLCFGPSLEKSFLSKSFENGLELANI